MSKTFLRSVSASAVLLLIVGCAVGPDYRTPVVPIDGSFISAGANAVDAHDPAADLTTFWRGFSDPMLTQLVERAIAANFDVRIAQARLQEARTGLTGARAELFPEIDGAGGAGRALQPGYLFPGETRGQRTGNVFDSHFVANWELDFFGHNRRLTESAAAQVDASAAGVHAARTVVIAEVARTYLDLRGLQARYAVAERSLENQRQTLHLVSVRLDAGRSTQLDVARASSLYDSTEALLPALQASIDRDAYRLATLTAQSPRTLADLLATPQALPALPVTDLATLPLGTPEQLLRRRPDLIAAERQLASANADIGVATADLFPRISLTGSIGFASARGSQLGKRDSQNYAYGAGLVWPILDFGRVRARIHANQAAAVQALAVYEQTVAVALEEIEDSLSQFTRTARQAGLMSSATRSAEEATRLSRLRFTSGSVDLLIVLDAERQSLSAEDALVQAQVGQATALVSVYRSMGGGWDPESLVAAR
jgi:outer membrane protein, multidrug efflux system